MVVQGIWPKNYAWFSSFTKIKNGGDASFGDNSKGNILGIGNVGKVSSTLIENVCVVGNLKHNLISISQLCDKGYKVVFDKFRCVITTRKIAFTDTCLMKLF